jgi:hypothetical protein
MWLQLSRVLSPVSHVKEDGNCEDRERDNGTNDTWLIFKVRSNYDSKSEFRGIPPTIGPTFGPSSKLVAPVGPGELEEPVLVIVLLGPELVPVPTVLICFGFASGSPDQN